MLHLFENELISIEKVLLSILYYLRNFLGARLPIEFATCVLIDFDSDLMGMETVLHILSDFTEKHFSGSIISFVKFCFDPVIPVLPAQVYHMPSEHYQLV